MCEVLLIRIAFHSRKDAALYGINIQFDIVYSDWHQLSKVQAGSLSQRYLKKPLEIENGNFCMQSRFQPTLNGWLGWVVGI